ncbi:DUF1405 domain-containing protein [Paenibacillus sp. IB182496]|uniref:DUF1405 domain-containing protein n=1 Tax=Paenibacillus sabuli TaxID=2772509 RepID=A0A927BTB8_9BACL|nr:DUF1405 domain-containing protein [Paenibacillus sabuli]MBD2845139.1 DUF1405 domain-containing protein [Paenibacillus sabuli]
MPLSLLRFWSAPLLMNRNFLWLLFIVNALGTVYGYVWYGNQLADTWANHPMWRIVFVPDSPTGSLFFTAALLFLLFPARRQGGLYVALRSVIEALAVATSLKYGIWAVAMIFAGAAQGDQLVWQDWMLVVSHLGMALEGLLYVRFMAFGRSALLVATGWMLLNDAVDYRYEVYPWLPSVLTDDIAAIARFTIGLSVCSALIVALALIQRKHRRET